MKNNRWQFWIDVGGTFTDCFALAPSGNEFQLKILSSGFVKGTASFVERNVISVTTDQDPGRGFWVGAELTFFGSDDQPQASATVTGSRPDGCYEIEPVSGKFDDNVFFQMDCQLTAPVLAIHILTGTPLNQRLQSCDVYLGTTRGTNALLTRSGAKTALVTSVGLADFLTIGDQARPELFALTVKKPEPLFTESIAINERVLADGTVELVPDKQQVCQQLQELADKGIQSIAVCLMHGFRYPDHEQLVKGFANEIGFRDVRLSSEVAPVIKLISRGETTVLDAYLNPVISDYFDAIQQSLGPDSNLQLITSAGVLSRRDQFSGKDSVLSGPAGGVVGAAGIAGQLGFEKCIGFDMGGTSTDVARYDGAFELEYESRKAGVRIVSPMMSIETVASGGGSVCGFDGTRLTVGPDSAGADPGPACYGTGGPLTVTDINLFLGRLDEQQFPFPLNRQRVYARLDELIAKIQLSGNAITRMELASGLLRIANHNMASAIRTISVKRGFDPRGYCLVSFGGAGSQHCCGVADELGITNILVHPKSSILSAFGIRLADQSYSSVHSMLVPFTDTALQQARDTALRLHQELLSKFPEESQHDQLEKSWSIDLKFEQTHVPINLPVDDSASLQDLAAAFHAKHIKQYGYSQQRPIEIVCVRCRITQHGFRLTNMDQQPSGTVDLHSSKTQDSLGKHSWNDLVVGNSVAGPAVIADRFTAIVVDDGWVANVQAGKQILLEKTGRAATDNATQTDTADPIELQIFYSSFQSIAEQMGAALRNTAISVNVKERLDFSCAVFSADGDLVVNAPHIPVHLGAMSEAVKATIRLNPSIGRGDVFVTNDPYAGGSHLPDVTVVTPFFDNGDQPVLWLANRAHHAEIGGIAPGSMPARATRLEQEGVLIENFQIAKSGQQQFDELRNLLTKCRYPSRNPDENIADITAQMAANQMGCDQLQELIGRYSLSKVLAYTDHIRTAAESKTKTALAALPDFERSFEDAMDDGTRIHVTVKKASAHLTIDFTGTDAVHPGNLNANPSIVSSAVLYVLRCMIDQDIPLNSGVLNAVSLIIPESCFLNPQPTADRADCPAVVGGNVETSQRIVDVLLGCFQLAAASQGTMNNWLVGDESFGYYETVGGGSGATAAGNGADTIHCHMSNTRLTDPEILETRYPMILREFSVRHGSGGRGRFCGGNGMVREVEFTQPLTLSILGSRRTTAPFGVQGGEPGSSGLASLLSDATSEELESQCERAAKPGDRLRLETPGGGGFGESSAESR